MNAFDTIHRHRIPDAPGVGYRIVVPEGAVFLSLAYRDESVDTWWQVPNAEATPIGRDLVVLGTGDGSNTAVDTSSWGLSFLGTYVNRENYVGHVFELVGQVFGEPSGGRLE